ncbi:hypothetical protein KNP414_04472 [Paenibacillus mucilaginosus KNP414]|uniref:Uncharacterized protein n=1 Tax=Paenibacillus mucilaginosus (strain KNP414) TaxID=1036673 RepID=F8F974_PAEMK|nr:hypothetical protein KNP414_04472 [Paenibacillus mucilaginosus KNP414]
MDQVSYIVNGGTPSVMVKVKVPFFELLVLFRHFGLSCKYVNPFIMARDIESYSNGTNNCVTSSRDPWAYSG